MKIKIYLLMFLYLCGRHPDLCAIHIINDSVSLDSRGYNNCGIFNNGEYMVLKAFATNNFIVFDVGANEGEYSGLVLNHSPQAIVYAFEPINRCFNKLIQRYPNLHSYNIAVADFDGEVTFRHYVGKDEEACSSFFIRPTLHSIHEDITVPVLSLDTFCRDNNIDYIDFLKIDTEGCEYKVLQGAKSLLSDQAIAVLQFEYGGTYSDAGITLKEVFDYLSRLNYSVFRICPDCLIHITTWRDSLENYQYSNYCAISSIKIKEIL